MISFVCKIHYSSDSRFFSLIFHYLHQTGEMLKYNDLCVRNDLQLMLLQRAWQAPWSPETHASFQPAFRVAVATIAKSIHRSGFPREIMLSICSFLHRDWWIDERRQCWNYACLSEKSIKMISRKLAPGYNHASIDDHQNALTNFEYCRRCHVAYYCCKSCRSRDLYVGHKARCCPALSRPPNDDEIQLYTKILVEKGAKSSLPTFLQSWAHLNNRKIEDTTQDEVGQTTGHDLAPVEGDDGGDDDASWETVDSSEEEEGDGIPVVDESKLSITQLARKYFDDK